MATKIRIYPAESGKITDEVKAQQLASTTPAGFRATQDVLVAAKKLNKGGGIFTSEKTLRKKLQAECYKLKDALRNDEYKTDELDGFLNARQGEVVMDYLTEFSDAFPNWQPEYETLNRYIPLYFT